MCAEHARLRVGIVRLMKFRRAVSLAATEDNHEAAERQVFLAAHEPL